MLLSYTIVDFHLFYDGAVDRHKNMSPSDKKSVKVYDTQVTVKACGPLVIFTSSFPYRLHA